MNHSELIARLRTDKIFDYTTLGNEAADALEALQTVKRVPMTDEQAYDLFGVMYQMPIIRAVEAHHNITPPESKG